MNQKSYLIIFNIKKQKQKQKKWKILKILLRKTL